MFNSQSYRKWQKQLAKPIPGSEVSQRALSESSRQMLRERHRLYDLVAAALG